MNHEERPIREPRQVVTKGAVVEALLGLLSLNDLALELGVRRRQLGRALGHALLELRSRSFEQNLLLPELDEDAHLRPKGIAVDRLRDVVDGAQRVALEAVVILRLCADEDDRRTNRGLLPL